MKQELYKTANKTTSFICEALMDDLKKIVLTLVLRDEQNKALSTLSYYLDIPAAKVLFTDIWHGNIKEEYKEFKRTEKADRALSILPGFQAGFSGYKITIMNSGESKDKLYFDLSFPQARQLSVTVLDFLGNYELAMMLSEVLKERFTDKLALETT